MSKKPVALIIMDGFGHNPSDYGNAIHAAKKPNLDKFMQGPNTLIGASGLDVGLPDGQMGNSEVGHTNIGAGRIVYQMLVKITKDIEDGKFFENPAISAAIDACKEKGTALHLMGLLSPGGRSQPYFSSVRTAGNGKTQGSVSGVCSRIPGRP